MEGVEAVEAVEVVKIAEGSSPEPESPGEEEIHSDPGAVTGAGVAGDAGWVAEKALAGTPASADVDSLSRSDAAAVNCDDAATLIRHDPSGADSHDDTEAGLLFGDSLPHYVEPGSERGGFENSGTVVSDAEVACSDCIIGASRGESGAGGASMAQRLAPLVALRCACDAVHAPNTAPDLSFRPFALDIDAPTC